jgi:hypothetical protein
MCKERDALVQLSMKKAEVEVEEEGASGECGYRCAYEGSRDERKGFFCVECADNYFASMPGMNSARI